MLEKPHTRHIITALISRYRLSASILFLMSATVIMSDFAVAEPLYLAKVSVDEAVRNVNRDRKRRVLGAKTEIIEGREVHVIKTLSKKGRVQNRRVDAETGKTLKRGRRR